MSGVRGEEIPGVEGEEQATASAEGHETTLWLSRRTGAAYTLNGGVLPHALTDDDRRKAAESRRRKREEAEIRKWEQLEPLALKRLGELLLRADDAVAQRAIADYLDRRPETAKIVRSKSLQVTAQVNANLDG